MPTQKDTLKNRTARCCQITISVIGRKSLLLGSPRFGKVISSTFT